VNLNIVKTCIDTFCSYAARVQNSF